MAMEIPVYPLVTSVVAAVAAAIAVRAARAVALKRALFDVPNARSSHKVPVPRLGGAAFIPVVLLVVLASWTAGDLPAALKAACLLGAVALFVVSLVDDFVSLATSVRFGVQFAAAGGVLAAIWISVDHGSLAVARVSFSPLVLWSLQWPLDRRPAAVEVSRHVQQCVDLCGCRWNMFSD